MVDPLSEVINLLQPRAVFSKIISGAGAWAVRYAAFEQPSFSAVLEGRCRLQVDGQPEIELLAGDFVLMPATPGFVMSGYEVAEPAFVDPKLMPSPQGEVRHGRQDGPAEVRMLGGSFVFGSQDASLLVSLLPTLLHVRDVSRLATLVQLVRDESLAQRPGREHVLGNLVEVLLVEALRANSAENAPVGLLRGLADTKLAVAMRALHADPARSWTVEELAATAALSRSAFFERFSRAVGVPPMEYLLAWRMSLAKDLLRRPDSAIATVAQRVGYGSASTFSTAFSRHVGTPPGRFAKLQ